jgi:murein DD-endopeptidase MepM/ murein hydrolase activator NlpD
MNQQQYFIVVVAHSLHGRLRRIHIPHSAVYAVLALALFGFFSLFGAASSYLRMVWKVANYNTLREEVDSLRMRYQKLEKAANQDKQQLASLQLFASEVSMAYGLKRTLEGPQDIVNEGRLVPTIKETMDTFDFLRTARIPRSRRNTTLMLNARPTLWPIIGHLSSSFGSRMDPFSGMGAFHAGVDIVAPQGSPVRVTGDGHVSFAGWQGGYGKLVIVDHPGGVQTYYAHLSSYRVFPGQEVRMGELIALSGSTGRSQAPHLHYEVRLNGSPVNPHKFLQNSLLASSGRGSRVNF